MLYKSFVIYMTIFISFKLIPQKVNNPQISDETNGTQLLKLLTSV